MYYYELNDVVFYLNNTALEVKSKKSPVFKIR